MSGVLDTGPFLDGFGHEDLTTTQMATKWTAASGSIIPSLNTGTTYGFRGNAQKTVGNYLTMSMGRRDFVAGPRDLATFKNIISGVNITFGVIADGRISAGVQGTFFKYSTFAITFGATYHFQIYINFNIDSAAGDFYNGTYSFQVYVNGVLRLTDSISTTANHYPGGGVGDTTQLNFSEFDIQSASGGADWVGDLWVTGTGELLGQCPVLQFFAAADGATLNWTPLTPGTHFSQINSRVTNDSTYNYDASVGDIDEYQMQTVPAGTVKAIQLTWRLEKDSAGAATLQGVYFDGTATTVLSTAVFAPSLNSFAFFREGLRKSVFTAADWTVAELNAMRPGIKRVS